MNEQKQFFDSVGRQMAKIQELTADDQGTKPRKHCPYCHGTGVMMVANGTDDFDREQCICTQR